MSLTPIHQNHRDYYPSLLARYQQSSMVIDFVDSESKQLIWQATVQGVVDEQDPVGQLDKAVMKALKQFPPQK